MKKLETERLILRPWKKADRDIFARINADPLVMEYMGYASKSLPGNESDALADRICNHFDEYGYGLYAVELKEDGAFIGFTGIQNVPFEAHFTPAIEMGWRLDSAQWGRGYATEAAREALKHAFEILNIKQLVSFTVPANIRSRRVMENLGMTHNPAEDFHHPRLPPEHERLVLYRTN